MATETYFLPGYGIVVDAEDGDEYFLPGYGVVANNETAAAPVAAIHERGFTINVARMLSTR